MSQSNFCTTFSKVPTLDGELESNRWSLEAKFFFAYRRDVYMDG